MLLQQICQNDSNNQACNERDTPKFNSANGPVFTFSQADQQKTQTNNHQTSSGSRQSSDRQINDDFDVTMKEIGAV